MNFGNFFGGRRDGNDCCYTIIWLLFLLSICGNGCGGRGDNDSFMLIILLLLICNCGCGDNMGCRG